MASDMRAIILAMLVADHGVSVTGFRTALRRIAEKAACKEIEDEDEAEYGDECASTLAGRTQTLLEEWFLWHARVIPAAFRIDLDERGYPHIHVWEIELSYKLPLQKLTYYGSIADVHEVDITLHLIDSCGREDAVLDRDALEHYFWTPKDAGEKWCQEQLLPYRKGAKIRTQKASAQDYVIATRNESERAILRAVYELGLFKPGENP